VFEEYEGPPGVEAHMATPVFKQLTDAFPEILAEEAGIAFYEVLPSPVFPPSPSAIEPY
jgi:quinol monooxygenase YgiN